MQILSLLAQLPPLLVAIILALALAARAATRWQPAMAIDPLLIGLYLWRPSVGMLAAVLALHAIRWVPALAREAALLIGAPNAHGWTLACILFMLPGVMPRRQLPATHAGPAPATPATGTTQRLTPAPLPAQAAEPEVPTVRPPLSAAEWLYAANDDPTLPHLGIVGPTRLGKTTFACATLGRRRGQFVITTPKAEDSDPWDGFPAVRLAYDLAARVADWRPIADAIGQVHFEMLRRNATNSILSSDWINLVVDEFSTTIANIAAARQQVIDLLLMGASARIRVVLISPDVNVRAWGIEGRRDVIDNLVFAKVQTGRLWSLGRIDANGRLIDPVALDTRQVLTLAGDAQLAGRAWGGLSVWTPPVGGQAAPATPGQQTADQTKRPMATDAELIALLGEGLTRTEIEARLHAQGKGLDNNRLTALRAQLGLRRRPQPSGARRTV